MMWIVSLLLSTLLCGCAQDHDQNNPYIIENTEITYEAPAPYYNTDVETD